MGVGVKGFGGSGSGSGPKLQGLSALPPAAVAAKGIFQPVSNPFRYWRLRTIGIVDIASIYEIAMIDTTDTPDYVSNDLTNGAGTPIADSSYSGSFDQNKAFDNSLGTRWNGDNTNKIHYIGYDFGIGNEKDIKKIRVRQVTGTATNNWVVENSSNGSDWTFVKNATLTNDVDVDIDLTI